jgi:hypothetical protein
MAEVVPKRKYRLAEVGLFARLVQSVLRDLHFRRSGSPIKNGSTRKLTRGASHIKNGSTRKLTRGASHIKNGSTRKLTRGASHIKNGSTRKLTRGASHIKNGSTRKRTRDRRDLQPEQAFLLESEFILPSLESGGSVLVKERSSRLVNEFLFVLKLART